MPTQAATDNKQKANITTAIENTECPSIALDEAAPIICTKVLAALMDPTISGIRRSASFVAYGEIKPQCDTDHHQHHDNSRFASHQEQRCGQDSRECELHLNHLRGR
ncbi:MULTISPECIES: hypothetical protein [Bradyrhizobium]|uniref:Uncharacterized protein n=1 Tax=Bradyrhizobium xenonodulans TaxID=2736875 RepID=A0ABY7MJ79_9BRAD|nr:hypothetical protein [Bradyrhizobium xenonodulans]WBL77613.1 hypothetical protein I3J27_32080 [Bradyrhizobium xenonodulans]